MANKSIGLTEEYLREHYTNQKKGTYQISQEFGCSASAVHNNLKKFNIPIRSVSEARIIQWDKRGRPRIYKTCPVCGKTFELVPWEAKKVKHCSNECGHMASRGRPSKNKGRPMPDHVKKMLIEMHMGKPGHSQTAETKKRISDLKIGLYAGEKNPNWRGGISFRPYCKKFSRGFRDRIREKFGGKCYLCPTGERKNKRSPSIHHIDYNKNSICNGKEWAFVPLCSVHHTMTNYNRWYWFNLLINYWAYDYMDFTAFSGGLYCQ